MGKFSLKLKYVIIAALLRLVEFEGDQAKKCKKNDLILKMLNLLDVESVIVF